MPEENHSLDELVVRLQQEHNFSDDSIALLKDKGLEQKEFQMLYEVMNLPDETFEERRKSRSWIDKMLDRGDSQEITTGRYERYVESFKDISSEQALVRGRMKFAVEYDISLADLIANDPRNDKKFIEQPFTDEEKSALRNIYQNFRTKDYLAAKIIERKTNQDIVAANAWVVIRAQQLGLDADLMRRVTHFARTSSDLNTNITGELYMKAIGKWTSALSRLVHELKSRAEKYATITCIARTHGQNAQFTTLGHIYANLAEQIKLHAKPLLGEEMLRLDGKIAGAIGTDIDMEASFPHLNFKTKYEQIVQGVFGLNYVELGNDQDCSNAALARALDTMVNVGYVLQKAATDVWLYTSRDMLAKQTKEGEAGSSIMPQKTNPFFAESCEALIEIVSGMINPIKKLVIAYREQGDLRRSITKREGFHPVMLSIIAIERLLGEIKNYEPNIIGIEAAIYHTGPKVASSVINNRLRAQGVSDAYDRVKDIVMKPYVQPSEVTTYIDGLVTGGKINPDIAKQMKGMLLSVMDTEGLMQKLQDSTDEKEQQGIVAQLTQINSDVKAREKLLGRAVGDTYKMVENAKGTCERLGRYAA